MSKVTTVLKNKFFLSVSGNVIMSGLGMLTMVLIYRFLPITDVGIWVFFTSTLLLIDTIRSGFLTTAFIKFYAGTNPQRAAEIAGSTWFIGLCLTGVLILINIPCFFFLKNFHDKEYIMLIKWSSICFVCMLPWFIATCVIQGEQQFDKLLYVRFVQQGTLTLFIIVLICLQKLNLHALLFSYILSHFITSVFTIINGWSRINTLGRRTHAATMELFNFGKFSVGTTLSSNLFSFSDTFIINTMLGPAALAVFNLGQTLMTAVGILINSFAATAMPSLASANNKSDKDSVIYVMKKYVGMVTFMLIPVVVFGVLLADLPIYLIGGHKYVGTAAANVFRISLAVALLYPADRYFALTLDVIHKPQINFYKVLMMLAANITFDLLGIYIFGNIYGIAAATVMPVLVGVIVGYWALNKYNKFSFVDVYSVGYLESLSTLKEIWQKFRHKAE